jgi:sugar phosphate isomerase/epimerase
MASYESFYDGGITSLSPNYGNFTGYRMTAAQLGFPGSAQTANQLGETVTALKQGVKAFEVSMVMPDTAETIPVQHFKEMRALMKLSGVKPSVHGPVIDAAGFTDKGWGGDEGRADNERRMFDSIEKAHILDPNGNIPIVFHSSNGAPGAEWKPGDKKLGEDKFIMEKSSAINRETGQAISIKREHKFRPELDPTKSFKFGDYGVEEVKGGKPGLLYDAESSVGAANRGEWENKLTEVAQMNKHAQEILGASSIVLNEYKDAVMYKDDTSDIIDLKTGQKMVDFNNNIGQKSSYNQIRNAGLFLDNAELSFKGAFHQAYKYGTDEQQEKLKDLAKTYTKEINKTSGEIEINGREAINIWGPISRQKLLDESLGTLREITARHTPEVFQETEKFAMEKAADTFGNLAMKSYDKFGKTAPVIAVENMFQGFAFSRAEDLKKLVETSREKFAKQLVDKKGLRNDEANKIAEKHLGVTWDVGHLNILKKKGFTDKDIIEQTKKINPLVKHIHLTDNFGYADTHLAPGMGNTPIKGILEELEKNGQFAEMRKITEAGNFVQHFKTVPHALTLAAFGSPLYGMKSAPYWNQVMDMQGAYFGGYGTSNPSQHQSIYGAGFTTMPVDLGGQMGDTNSRFGGTPMA